MIQREEERRVQREREREREREKQRQNNRERGERARERENSVYGKILRHRVESLRLSSLDCRKIKALRL
jgi:hypothetical protein